MSMSALYDGVEAQAAPEAAPRRAVVVGPGALAVGRVLRLSGFSPIVVSFRPKARRRKRYAGLPVLRARPGELPLRPGSAALVVVAGGLGAASDIVGGLVQLSRVLAPGGLLAVLSPEPGALHSRLLRAPGDLLFRRRAQALPHEHLTAAFLLAGLSEVRQEEVGLLFPLIVTTGRATRASAALGALYP